MSRDANAFSHRQEAATMMETLRARSRPMRLVCLSVLLFFLNASIWPNWALALEIERQKDISREIAWDQDNRQLHQVLANLREHMRGKRMHIDRRIAEENGVINGALSLLGLAGHAERDERSERFLHRLSALHDLALTSFDQTAEHLREKSLPGVIQQRHEQARERFAERHAVVRGYLNAVNRATSLRAQQQALNELEVVLADFPTTKARDPFDPDNLPWGTPDPALTPEPAKSADQFSVRNGVPLFEGGEKLASNLITPEMLGNPGGPTTADLQSTPDAVLSDAIVAKAADLDHNPVAIYQWVRNHIEFIPSHGSIQGADYTLQHGRGNAFDTASLLIALLRASNVPARYAFGTVRVPADQVMNWVGNVNVPEAAGNLLGQGGIPNRGLTIGGQIRYFELEHVWVESWIDYLPSRGAKHRVGDSWVPMDASFKQYEYSEGMALDQQVPFDADALVHAIEQHSTINESEGWMQHVPQQKIEAALEGFRTQLEDFLTNQHPDATVGDVLGSRQIKRVIRESLSASLPYELITRKLVASSLPDNLRWKFRYQLSTSLYGRPGSTLLSIERPTVQLVGQKLALSFKPATEADEATLASYLPEPNENGEIHPEDIPDTLPGYLISLLGEFSIGNDTAATAALETTMGTELHSEMGYWQPGRGWQTSRNYPIAGEYRAIALDLQGISQQQAQQLQTDLESTQLKLEAEDFTDLTKQQLVGDLLYSTILGYFALNNVQDQIAQTQTNSVGYRAPSYGLFKTSLTPEYWYGIPRNVRADGLGMDVDRMISQRVDKQNNQESWLAFNRAQGARMSAMEHLVPEQMFSTEEAPANGISAVKAIQLAAAEGQKIYTITQQNLSIALQQIQLSSEIKADIRNAVSAGMEVTTHQAPVNFFGRPSVGYILLDPNTGAGAYRIGGGENGSEFPPGPGQGEGEGVGIIKALSNISIFVDIFEAINGLNSIPRQVLGFLATLLGFVAKLHALIDACKEVKPAGAISGFIIVYTLATAFGPLLAVLLAAAIFSGGVLMAIFAVVFTVVLGAISTWIADISIGICERRK